MHDFVLLWPLLPRQVWLVKIINPFTADLYIHVCDTHALFCTVSVTCMLITVYTMYMYVYMYMCIIDTSGHSKCPV